MAKFRIHVTLRRGECRCRLLPKFRESISQHHKGCLWFEKHDTITLIYDTSGTAGFWARVLWYQPSTGPDPNAIVRRRR